MTTLDAFMALAKDPDSKVRQNVAFSAMAKLQEVYDILKADEDASVRLYLEHNPYRKYSSELLKAQAMEAMSPTGPLELIELANAWTRNDFAEALLNKAIYTKPEWAIEALKQCDDIGVYRTLAMSPILALLPDEFTGELWNKNAHRVYEQLGRNIYIPQSHALLERLFMTGKAILSLSDRPVLVDGMQNLASNPAVGMDGELMHLIVDKKEFPPEMHVGLAYNPFIGEYPDLAEVLMESKAPLIQKGLIRNASMIRYDSYIKDVVSGNYDSLRRFLALNPLLDTSEELKSLVQVSKKTRSS